MTDFMHREKELSRLNSLYDTDEAELIALYGRRQIGKTDLVLESLSERENAVYHQAIQSTRSVQINRFIEDAESAYPDITNIRQDWEPLLSYLIDRNTIVVLDEFPYLIEQDKSLPSIIQRLWDHEVDDSSGTLVLTGSSIGMMKDHVLGGSAPIYGRISQAPNGKIKLTQLPFSEAMKFFPDYSPEEKVFTYGVFGGTPRYLLPVNDSQTLDENISRTLLDTEGALHDEPETVLQMELDEVNRYFALLESMAKGNRKRNKISQDAGLRSRDTGYYFDRLETLDIIERHHPVTADPPSKKTRYRIRDPLFRFWFRYIYGKSGRYELYGENAYKDLIEPDLPDFVSDTFERLCQQALAEIYDYNFTRVPGNWWHKEHEIDIVAPTDTSKMVVGEAKFRNQPIGYDVLSDLENDADHIEWSGHPNPDFEYVLFSRSGFKRSVKEAEDERDDLLLVDLEEVVELLNQVE